MMGVTVFATGGTMTAEPTVNLRFMNGRLQQMWVWRGGATVTTEWRDVPDATPPQEPRE